MILGIAQAAHAAALPDLIVTALTGPASGSTAASITISNTVANIGAGSLVDECYIAFYLSTDTVVTTEDILLGNRGIYGGILPGGTNSGTVAVGIPASLAAGTYYLGAIVDYDNRNTESDEGNNAFVGSTIAIQIGPDLVMTQVVGPSTGYTAAAISVDYAAANIGLGNPPDECVIGFYLSTDTVVTTGDILLGTRGIYGGFPPGTTNSGTASVNIPPALAAGTYYLGAIVDVYNLNPEFSETNNALAGGPIQIQIGPDLVMTQVVGPSTGYTAAAISVDYAAANIGLGNPPDECVIGFYLSTDTVVTTGDILLGTRGIYGGFPPGTTNSGTASVNIPPALAAGTYYLGAIVDVYNLNPEFSETNNALAGGPIQIQVGPDLVMAGLSAPPTGCSGAPLAVGYAAANIGVGNPPDECYIGFYLSTDTVVTVSDTLLTTRGIYGGFPPGTTNAGDLSVNLPAGLAPGTYYLGAIVDVYNLNPEFSESNNSLASGPVYLAPAAQVMNLEANVVSVSFLGLRASSAYRVQRASALYPEPAWTNTGAVITGVVSTNWSEPISPDSPRAYYRLIEN